MVAVTVMSTYQSVLMAVVAVLAGMCMVATVVLLFGDLHVDWRTNGS